MTDVNRFVGPLRLADMRYALRAEVEDVSVVLGVTEPSWWDGTLPKFEHMDEIVCYFATPDETDLDIRWVSATGAGGFWYIAAWNDYTGWGCQDGVTGRWAPDLPTLITFGLDKEDRRRWGLLEVVS